MLTLPKDLSQKFNDLLAGKSFPDEARASYLKWLRFYWDFCKKYQYDPYSSESLFRFLDKLAEKQQSEQQQNKPGIRLRCFIACNTAWLLQEKPHRRRIHPEFQFVIDLRL